jgi:uncharacterized protein DUF6766
MRRLRDHGLSLFFLVLFGIALVGQSIAGLAAYNDEQVAHGAETVSYLSYIVSPEFGQAVMENWQSEYLQFTLYIAATIWLVQRGSPESKPLGDVGTESDEEQRVGEHARKNSPAWARAGGIRLWLYSNSLLLVMVSVWIGSWFAQSLTGWRAYDSMQTEHHEATVSWLQYIGTADFWESTLQNWQSEFLAVGSMVVLSIYLRQRGSPESKPVGVAHAATGIES